MRREVLLLSLIFAACAHAAEERPAPKPHLPSSADITRAFETPFGERWTFQVGKPVEPMALKSNPDSPWDLSGCSRLAVKALRTKAGRSVVRLRWVLYSRLGGMYLASSSTVVPTGSAADVELHLNQEGALVPVGHQRPWDSLAAAEVASIELRPECYFSSANADEGIFIDLSHPALESTSAPQPPARLLDLALEVHPEGSRAAAALTFRIEPPPADPYEVAGQGDVRIALPDGRQVLAYFDQAYVDAEDGSSTRSVAAGRPVWRAWLPSLPSGEAIIISGDRRWSVPATWFEEQKSSSEAHGKTVAQIARTSASSGPSEEISRPTRRSSEPARDPNTSGMRLWDKTLECTLPRDTAISGGAPPYWELSHGEWRPPSRVEPIKADSAWTAVPFWNARWGGFAGARRPCGELCERLDDLLQEAAAAGQARPLVILDGATFERQSVFNWDHHPLNGVLSGPGELLRDPRGVDYCKRWMRYACARWGMSRAVNGLLLTCTLYTPGASTFHAELASALEEWSAASGLSVRTLHPFARAPQLVAQLHSFENDPAPLNPWYADGRMSNAVGSRIMTAGSDGRGSYEVRAIDPASTTVGLTSVFMFGAPEKLSQADALLFDVWIPQDAPHDLRLGVHVCDRQGRWYETLLPGLARPGDWTTYVVDLTSDNVHKLKPVKHEQAWRMDSRARLSELGLHVYSIHPRWTPKGQNAPQPLTARFDNVRAVRFHREDDVAAPPSIPVNYTQPQIITDLGNFDVRERGKYTWNIDERICRGTGSIVASNVGKAYEVVAATPAATSIGIVGDVENVVQNYARPADNLGGCDAITFDVFIPPAMPADLRVGIHLRDRDGQWFQAIVPGCPRPGEWTTFGLDITGANFHGLVPGGNSNDPEAAVRRWTDYSRQRVKQIGLHVFSTHPNWAPKGAATPLTARFDNVRGVRFDAPEHKRVLSLYEIPDAVLKAAGESASVYTQGVDAAEYFTGDLWQCHFKCNRAFNNPYDPRDCDLTAIITTPGGKRVHVPAFFNQVCRRREAKPGGEELTDALGEEFFTVRYRITEPGDHQVTLELREGGSYQPAADPQGRGEMARFTPGAVTARLDLGAKTFAVKAGQRPGGKTFHGFVRVAANKRNFEWDDGTFFYPMGPCLRSPSDNRIPYADAKWNLEFLSKLSKRGTYQYDEYFKKYQEAGINWARVWMCSWWVSLEWRRDWPGYQGAGRYNLLNAWRMDYLLEQAEQKDITLMLCLTNHGQCSTDVDQEWNNNPLNQQLGGPLANAREFFTSQEAKALHQNRLRYIAARYGHSPAVMAWSLFSEVEWVEEYKRSLVWGGVDRPAPNIELWHAEMASFLKQIDPNHHLVSTHFSHPVRGEATLALPEIEIASSNAYSAFDYFKLGDNIYDAALSLAEYWMGNKRGVRGFKIFNKPAMVEEQGRHWMGVDKGTSHNSKAQLDADLHAGLWGSMVQPLCGATGYWWWLHVHYDDRYSTYRALANFMKDEDFRPGAGENVLEPVARTLKADGQDLMGRAMKSNRRMYAWIYHPQMPIGGDTPEVTGGKLKVGSLQPGAYIAEFWDTYKGVVTETRDVEIKEGVSLELPLPPVKADIAVKIKPKKAGVRGQGSGDR